MSFRLERFTTPVVRLTNRLFGRAAMPTEVTPAVTTEPILTDNSTLDDSVPIPGIDYKPIAKGYFLSRFEVIAGQGMTRDQVVADLAQDPVLTKINPQAIGIKFDSGEDAGEIADALSDLLPKTLLRDARRTLDLFVVAQERVQENRSNGSSNKRRNGTTNHEEAENSANGHDEKDVSIKAKSIKYSIGRISQKIVKGNRLIEAIEMTEEELMDFIQQRAKKLASKDANMYDDCLAMVDLVRENPYTHTNPGISQLRGFSRNIDNTVYPLYKFSPLTAPDFSGSHPRVVNLRMVFAKIPGEDLIAFDGDGIYTHRQFDRRYPTH